MYSWSIDASLLLEETRVPSDGSSSSVEADGTEGSTSLSMERTCRHALGPHLSRSRLTDHDVSCRVVLRGNVSLRNLLHDIEGNLLEMRSRLSLCTVGSCHR